MAKKKEVYRSIVTSFWTDPKIDEDFSPEDKYFYIYLLTNPHTNICGCYEEAIKKMAEETGYNRDSVSKLLDRLQNQHNVIKYNNDTREVLILNWGKWNWSNSQKLVKAVEKLAEFIKCDDFREYVIKLLSSITESDSESDTDTESDSDTDVSIGYGYGIDRVSIGYQKKKTKRTKFQNFDERDTNYDALERRLTNE